MPTPLPQPFEVTPGPVLQAMRLGQADRLEQEQRGALKAAGQFAAKGDLGGARNYLYGRGMVDEGAKFDQMLRQTDADALAKAQRSHAVLGNLALAADTPEKWSAAVDAASKAGLDVSKYQDFSAREPLLAQSGMVAQKLELEMKRRALDVKEEKPQWTFGNYGAGNTYTGEMKQPAGGVGADAGKLSPGERWRMKNGQPDLDTSGRPIAEPIPGSKNEAVPAETAARVGLADKFLKEMPKIRQDIEQGKLTSVDFQLGRGDAGDIYRRIEDGSEALVRNLTGAGMNKDEATTYARRFLPGRLDLQSTKIAKLDNLAKALAAVKNRVMVGRGISSTDDMEQAMQGKPFQDSLMKPPPPGGAPAVNDPLGILGH